jgi:hypothetical protein
MIEIRGDALAIAQTVTRMGAKVAHMIESGTAHMSESGTYERTDTTGTGYERGDPTGRGYVRRTSSTS